MYWEINGGHARFQKILHPEGKTPPFQNQINMAQQRPFRFLHTSNLHLGKPVTGVEELPAHLLKRFVDAPKITAERIFHAAMTEKVDFVLLSGEILDCYQTGPWGPVFLAEQFEKLNAAGILVFWAAGKSDSLERWPNELPIPKNVTVFPAGHIADPLFQKDGFAVARILGISRSAERQRFRPMEFTPDNTGLFTIAVVPGKIQPALLNHRGIDFWALGGMSKRHMIHGSTISSVSSVGETGRQPETARTKKVRDELVRPSVIHYPGTPLARSFDQTGHYGVSLVTVDEKGKVTVTLIPTSPIRFLQEEVRLDSATGFHRLKEELRDRMIAHQSLQENYDLMISWLIDGTQEQENELRRSKLPDEICEQMRKDFGMDEPYGWTVSVKTAVPENFPPEYYDQETLLGDYLQKIRQFQNPQAELPSLEPYLSPADLASPGKESLTRIDPKQRDAFLRQAAELGVDLLAPKSKVASHDGQ
ncbi:MAG: hypothetical protein LBQ54_14225 [Planctomycetaceae bacterium]|jgi:hypothetical protein|nr:hypothetical protein [Planctomycetaceae bacterium]